MALLLFNSLIGKKNDWAKHINTAFPDIDVREWPEIGDPVDIEFLVIGRPSLEELPHLPNLKLMLTMLAGVEGIFKNPACPPGIPLVKGEPPGGDPELTEYAITHVLRHHRNLPIYLSFQRQHIWQPVEQKPPRDQRVGILGYGTLSKPVADALIGLKFDVAAWTRTKKQASKVKIFPGIDNFDKFLNRTDILVCLLPLTNKTKGILNNETFSKMPKGASIINLGRGAHIINEHLIGALNSGQLSAATLDVSEPERLPNSSPLWDHPCITILPHVARRPPVSQIAPVFIDNIKRFKANKPLRQLTDRDRQY